MLNLKKLCDDYGIQYWTSGKNVSDGWINVQCPFCDDQSNHLGFSPQGKFYCWKCGSKHTQKVIQRICDTDAFAARAINIKYDTSSRFHLLKKEIRKAPETLVMPVVATNQIVLHSTTRYLQNRGFNFKELQGMYYIYVTNHLDPDYKFRIIIPILYKNKLVSFVGRDFTGKQELRYKACPKEKEILNHKSILYNLDNCRKDFCIVVEGIFDCWRIGDDCCSTFGASWTEKQAFLLTKRFKKVCILFDNDETGINQGQHLMQFLNIMGIEAIQFKPPSDKKDPAEWTNKEAETVKAYIIETLDNLF